MSPITPAQQLFDLTGEVALVTGASSGLGRRFAKVLAAHGAKVVAAARRTDRLKDLAASSTNIAPLVLDVTDNASLGPALDEAENAFGPLTLLVNNAGIGGGSRIVDTEPGEWDAVQETNVGIGLGDDLAVELENEAKHSVGRRVRGAHVEDELFPDQILGRRLIALEGLGAGGRVLDFDLS